jgi:hypothetical protein
MIKGIEELSENEVTSHTQCRFGKWYFDEANPFKND